MPPKRGQPYAERVSKRRRAANSSATLDSVVQPHPSQLQPVDLQEPPHAALATLQLTLSPDVLAALTTSISKAISETLLNVAQPRHSAAAPAIPELQFVPDPGSTSSTAGNRGSSIINDNPTTINADQAVIHTVNNAVQ